MQNKAAIDIRFLSLQIAGFFHRY